MTRKGKGLINQIPFGAPSPWIRTCPTSSNANGHLRASGLIGLGRSLWPSRGGTWVYLGLVSEEDEFHTRKLVQVYKYIYPNLPTYMDTMGIA